MLGLRAKSGETLMEARSGSVLSYTPMMPCLVQFVHGHDAS